MIHRPTILEKSLRSKRRGFTLLEVLVVVAIIVMLAGAGGYLILQRFEEARVSKARMDVNALSAQLDMYYSSVGQYPPSLDVLTQNRADGGGAYIRPDMLLDPWGKPYQMDPNGANNNGTKADVFTTTPKGIMVGNWSTK